MHKHRLDSTQAASPVWGIGPQPYIWDATSFDGQPCCGWVVLFAEPIIHENYIIHFNSMANSPMGLGLTNTMEPRSYPSWHTNRTPRAQFTPGSALQFFMVCNSWTRLWTENNTDTTASSLVSHVQPTPCQNYAIQTSHTLWAPSHGHSPCQGCSQHTRRHCQTGAVWY